MLGSTCLEMFTTLKQLPNPHSLDHLVTRPWWRSCTVPSRRFRSILLRVVQCHICHHQCWWNNQTRYVFYISYGDFHCMFRIVWRAQETYTAIWYMSVSKNNGTPKSSILIEFSIIFTIHFGIPLFLELPILCQSKIHDITSWVFFMTWG